MGFTYDGGRHLGLEISIYVLRVPCVAPTETLYREVCAQVFAVLQSPQSQGEQLVRGEVRSETG